MSVRFTFQLIVQGELPTVCFLLGQTDSVLTVLFRFIGTRLLITTML
jgi:hypothetical protein